MKEAIKGDPKIAGLGKEIVMEKGKRVFIQTCFACHQATGLGLPGVFPPLAGSDYLMADKARSIRAKSPRCSANYQRDPRGQFAHSNVITLRNADGEIVHQQTGLNTAPSGLLSAIAKLLPPAANP